MCLCTFFRKEVPMNLDELLLRWGQSHLLSLVPKKADQKALLHQLLCLDQKELDRQREFFCTKPSIKRPPSSSPWERVYEKNETFCHAGEEMLREGKVAALMLAAGEGSRLQFSGPKGCFPFSIVKHKTLFQIFCEKILAAQKKYQTEIFLMIMTSFLNQKETQLFFEKKNFFGLKKSQVAFFVQGHLPVCDREGKWLLEQKTLLTRASGNGDLFRSFVQSNLLQRCREKKIETILLFPVDNPLCDPVDAQLVGFHEERKCDVALYTIRRPKKETSMGVLAHGRSGPRILEYMEIPPGEIASFPFAHTGIYCVNLFFLEKAAALPLPLHCVQKTICYQGKETKIFKCEKFLFDAFSVARKIEPLLTSKSSHFAPLKRAYGKDGLAAVRKAFLAKERRLFYHLLHRMPSRKNFELSQEFYYPTSALLRLYQKKVYFHRRYFKGIDL